MIQCRTVSQRRSTGRSAIQQMFVIFTLFMNLTETYARLRCSRCCIFVLFRYNVQLTYLLTTVNCECS